MNRLYDLYVITVGCIILRILIKDNALYFISSISLGIGMGIYSGLQR